MVRQVLLDSPILTEWGLMALKRMDANGIRASELDATFEPAQSLQDALHSVQTHRQVSGKVSRYW